MRNHVVVLALMVSSFSLSLYVCYKYLQLHLLYYQESVLQHLFLMYPLLGYLSWLDIILNFYRILCLVPQSCMHNLMVYVYEIFLLSPSLGFSHYTFHQQLAIPCLYSPPQFPFLYLLSSFFLHLVPINIRNQHKQRMVYTVVLQFSGIS